MSDPGIKERPRTSGPGSAWDSPTRVVVLDDDHNTFQGVAAALARYIPGVDFRAGMALATRIHTRGSACVWSGAREVAELYWEQLAGAGLTMAPLE